MWQDQWQWSIIREIWSLSSWIVVTEHVVGPLMVVPVGLVRKVSIHAHVTDDSKIHLPSRMGESSVGSSFAIFHISISSQSTSFLDLLDGGTHMCVVFEAEMDQIDHFGRLEMHAQLAIKPQPLDIVEVALQDLAEELETQPVVGVLGHERRWCRVLVVGASCEERVECRDLRDETCGGLGFVDGQIREIKDIADDLGSYRIDE